jgi:molecular chaperone GrpE
MTNADDLLRPDDSNSNAQAPENWPDRQQILSRLGQWLDETGGEVNALDDSAADDEPGAEPVGLFQLVEKLTALRHEVKLLTKAARGSEERTEATLLAMQAAIEQFRSVQTKAPEAADKVMRPLIESIVDLDESLLRGRRGIENARRRVMEELDRDLQDRRERFEALYRAQPWWRRLLCRPWHSAATDIFSDRLLAEHRNVLDSLLEGYDLILARFQRMMPEQSIVRMDCVGRQVDPNSMTVLEAVSDLARPPGMVIEEVRPGYYWRGEVFRYAEVRAVGEH